MERRDIARTAYYDQIGKKWHAVTGRQGGALKELVLNDLVLGRISGVAGSSILELGAGNGYFVPLLLRRFSGQVPSRIAITDCSPVLLRLAQQSFRVDGAEYRVLDVREPFPFSESSFDLLLANMVFNEISTAALRRALRECRRMLKPEGRLLATVTHPAFVQSLERRGLLKPGPGGVTTMPGAEGLRLPVVPRTVEEYQAALQQAGFQYHQEEVCATPEVLKVKPGLREAGNVPVAWLLECQQCVPQTEGGLPER